MGTLFPYSELVVVKNAFLLNLFTPTGMCDCFSDYKAVPRFPFYDFISFVVAIYTNSGAVGQPQPIVHSLGNSAAIVQDTNRNQARMTHTCTTIKGAVLAGLGQGTINKKQMRNENKRKTPTQIPSGGSQTERPKAPTQMQLTERVRERVRERSRRRATYIDAAAVVVCSTVVV